MPQKATIRIPAERMTQIQQIIAARGLKTVNDLIAYWIRREVGEGTIQADIPGVTIEIDTNNHVGMTIGELMLNTDREEAKELARSIRAITQGHEKALATKIVRLRAAGTGFAIESLQGLGKYVASKSILNDIADQIDASVK
ncbi:hypothetical protein [Paracoccus sp. J56]|uniref:hypothetical protein n=1 Tax=Paracoccus sp. J56 TaxID=935850 RepID=UPI000A0BB635|nr:hypothetical protein [Paracoccus sp. J56]SMG45369.1 hypothetical protein SAMN02746000_02767 [Paracoccus sp. J56]